MMIRKELGLPGQAPFLDAGEVMAIEDDAGKVKLFVGDEDGVPKVVEAGPDPPAVYAAYAVFLLGFAVVIAACIATA